jgi:sulfatase modifying factor 1
VRSAPVNSGFLVEEREMKCKSSLVVVAVLGVASIASAELIRGIDIDFVTIGNPGNPAFSTGHGAVDYVYRIGKYEITNAQWDQFVISAGSPSGFPPWDFDNDTFYTGDQKATTGISWYEAAMFCNWLTSGNKSKGAYTFGDHGVFSGINREAAISVYGTVYVIPTDDEWFKAAYYKPNASGYSLYANGYNQAAPSDWNYGATRVVWDVGTGSEEQNGTYDMMGNVWEWTETWTRDSAGHHFVFERGGSHRNNDVNLSAYNSFYESPAQDGDEMGFRIAVIPEPATAILLALGAVLVGRRR